ncbi:MAG: ribonuclease HI family protein [Acidobacteria bacterium]|nr:ribonuclease HI family protein [Acidobacteriota bacterium]
MTGDLFALSSAEKTQRSGGWINAHCDGGARGNPGPSGYGAVIVAEDGTPLAELSEFLGIRTNNFAEYSGLLGVLRWTLEHGYTKLRVVSDSELMVKQIQGKYKVNSSDLKTMHAEARNMIRQLDAFEISHALRHKNKQADKLANDAMDRGSKRATNAPPLNATPYPSAKSAPPQPARIDPAKPEMLRGIVKDGVVVFLGQRKLPEGATVKVIPE